MATKSVSDCIRSDAIARGFLSKRLGVSLSEPYCGYALLDDEMQTVGAFVLNNYSGTNANLTIACDVPLGIRAARFIAYVIFVDLGCGRVTATTKSTNIAALKALRQVGFTHEGVLRRYFGKDDGHIFGLLADEQKLIRR